MYLVMARFGVDDVPLRLFARRKEALDYINSVFDTQIPRRVGEMVYQTNIGSPLICITLIQFVDGIPQPIETIV